MRHPGGIAHRADVNDDVGRVARRPRSLRQIEAHAHLRMRLDELRNQRRNVNAPETERRDDVQAARQAAPRASERVGQGVDLLEQALRLGHEALALTGEANVPVLTGWPA